MRAALFKALRSKGRFAKPEGLTSLEGGKTAVLPTLSMDQQSPPPRLGVGSLYRRGLMLRGLTAGFLGWVWWQFPHMSWDRAWILALVLAVVDGLELIAVWRWPHAIARIIPITVIADGLIGWGIAWSFSQSPQTLVPVLLTLFAQEILTYYPNQRGALLAEGYILVTNGLLGVIPGLRTTPIWPWSVVGYWVVADTLILGALLAPVYHPLRPTPVTLLTVREREIYELVAAGWTTTAIAQHLHIEVSTVRSHMAHIQHKLGGSLR